MTKKDYADITVVLDESGSMKSIKADTIGGFNTFLDDQKKSTAYTTFSLMKFNDRNSFIIKGVPVNDVAPIMNETYEPSGNTALFDAIGNAIRLTGVRFAEMQECERPDKVVFVILSDGEENSSVSYNSSQIKEMITHQTDNYKWQFLFIGANQDAILKGSEIGVSAANAMTMDFSGMGIQQAYSSVSSNIKSFVAGTSLNASFSASDRAAQDALMSPKVDKDFFDKF